MADLAAIAARALSLVELTSLDDDDMPATVAALCRRAVTPVGKVAAAARDVLAAGADFLKTSTGKTAPAATPQAAEVMLETIAAHRARTGRIVGFKAAGGIRSAADAGVHLALADRLTGADYARPASFRFGASGLLDELPAQQGAVGQRNRAGRVDAY